MKKTSFLRHFTAISSVIVFVLCLSMSASATPEKTAVKAPVKPTVQLVNINTADAAQLATLPGIGPSLAERIVKYRKESGAFKAPQDLGKVNGVGEKKLAKIIDRITIK